MNTSKSAERLAAEAFPYDGSDPDTVRECRRRAVVLVETVRAEADLTENGEEQ